MSSFDVKNYPGLYHLHLGNVQLPYSSPPTQQGGPSVQQTYVQVTPIPSTGFSETNPGFVYLPNGDYATVDALGRAGIPKPKFKYVGTDKHPALKEITVQGHRILYYEYPSKFGHTCRLEIVGGPAFIENHLFGEFTRSKSKNARSSAEKDMVGWVSQQVDNHNASLAAKKVKPISAHDGNKSSETPPAAANRENGSIVVDLTLPSQDSPLDLTATSSTTSGDVLASTNAASADSSPTGETGMDSSDLSMQATPEKKNPELRPGPEKDRDCDGLSEDQQRKKEIKEGLQEAGEAAFEVYNEHVEGAAAASSTAPAARPVQETDAPSLVDSMKASAQKVQNAALGAMKNMERMVQKKVKVVQDAANDVRQEGRSEAAHGQKQLKKARQLDKAADYLDAKLAEGASKITLKNNDGKEVTLTREQAKQVSSQARLKSQMKALKGVDNVFRGTTKASAGHGVASGAKKLGKEIGKIRSSGAEAFASNMGAMTVDFIAQGDYSAAAVEGAAKGVVHQTAKGVGVQIVQNVAHSALKGAAKELAPKLAEKIPGVSTINAVYSVGSAVFQAKSPEEAFENGIHAAVDLGIQTGCAALGQALIPVPILGTFLGSAVGSGVIHLKNKAFR